MGTKKQRIIQRNTELRNSANTPSHPLLSGSEGELSEPNAPANFAIRNWLAGC